MSNETGVNVNKIPVWQKLAKLGKGRSKRQQKLKAEREQLAAERVQELLSGMPGWGADRRRPVDRTGVSLPAAAGGGSVRRLRGRARRGGGTDGADRPLRRVHDLTLTSRLRGGSHDSLTENDFRFAARLG